MHGYTVFITIFIVSYLQINTLYSGNDGLDDIYDALCIEKTLQTKKKSVFCKGSSNSVHFNRVLSCPFITEDTVRKSREYFDNNLFSWWVPQTHTKLARYLESAGLEYDRQECLMVSDLTEPLLYIKAPENIRVCQVNLRDVHELGAWIETAALGLGTSRREVFEFIDYLFKNYRTKIRLYTGYWSNHPKGILVSAATSMLLDYPERKTVCLQLVSTRFPYRNKGLGYAVTAAALCAAKNKGFERAILLVNTELHYFFVQFGFTPRAYYSVYGYYGGPMPYSIQEQTAGSVPIKSKRKCQCSIL